MLSASAVEFHPPRFLDYVHEQFIEETKNKTPVKYGPSSPHPCGRGSLLDQETNPLSVHMEYCSTQLSKFEMIDSEDEKENNLPEMQCLPGDLAMALSSVKRSLLETLEKAESDKKMKCNVEQAGKWGPVLSNRLVIRNHGNVKIMDKATAYIQKKNLEIPASFKGKSFATVNTQVLADQIDKVDLRVGKNSLDQKLIIMDIIDKEINLDIFNLLTKILKLFFLMIFILLTNLSVGALPQLVPIVLLNQGALLIWVILVQFYTLRICLVAYPILLRSNDRSLLEHTWVGSTWKNSMPR